MVTVAPGALEAFAKAVGVRMGRKVYFLKVSGAVPTVRTKRSPLGRMPNSLLLFEILAKMGLLAAPVGAVPAAVMRSVLIRIGWISSESAKYLVRV